MRPRRPPAAARDRAGPHQEGSLIDVVFVGSFPAADFPLSPPLPEIAFIGRSNVGKSSLINAVVGRRAIARTSKTPGKTRECNVYRVNGRYHLVDLPGYGYARLSKPERRRLHGLLEAYLGGRERLAGVVWLLDIRRDPSDDDLRIGADLHAHGTPVLIALTKTDKLSRPQRSARLRTIARGLEVEPDQCLLTSSLAREGIVDLRESLDALAGEAA